jgi:hypothetical protein
MACTESRVRCPAARRKKPMAVRRHAK